MQTQKVVQGSGYQPQPRLRITLVAFSKRCLKDSELMGVGRGPGTPVTGQFLGDSRWARFRAGNKGEREDTGDPGGGLSSRFRPALCELGEPL